MLLMAVSSLHCVQSLGFSSRGRAFFPVGDCSRDNARKSKNCLVFASGKKSDRDLCLESKVLKFTYLSV